MIWFPSYGSLKLLASSGRGNCNGSGSVVVQVAGEVVVVVEEVLQGVVQVPKQAYMAVVVVVEV